MRMDCGNALHHCKKYVGSERSVKWWKAPFNSLFIPRIPGKLVRNVKLV